METVNVKLEFILPNPWQPRSSEDPEHIKKIALSIASEGLMQVPVGRWIHPDGKPLSAAADAFGEYELEDFTALMVATGWRVQLAFGHSRLAAFRWLEDVKANSNLVGDWSAMPVMVRELSDEEMFRYGIGENLARKDLSPIEEARAMERYRSDFGKTSAEIGELFGLSESAVRNKIRLLGLPDEIQVAAAEGRISEGAARELLTLFDLPEEMQEKAKQAWDYRGGGGRVSIVDVACAGAHAEKIRDLISNLVSGNSMDLSQAHWKWDQAFDPALDERIVSETCAGCRLHVKRDKKDWCISLKCWNARTELRRKEILALAAAATGIRPAEDLTRNAFEYIGLPRDEEGAAEIRASGCENLRLVFNEHLSSYDQQMAVEGHPKVAVMCSRKNGQCSCADGIEARRKLAAVGMSPTRPAASQNGKPAVDRAIAENFGIATASELKDLANQARKAKKQLTEEVKAIQQDFARRLAGAVQNQNAKAILAMCHDFISYQEREKWEKGDFSVEEILQAICLDRAEDIYSLAYTNSPDPVKALENMNIVLEKCDLPPLISKMSEPDPALEVQPSAGVVIGWEQRDPENGKTLTEVFGVLEPEREQVLMPLPQQLPGETLIDYFKRTDPDFESRVDPEFLEDL